MKKLIKRILLNFEYFIASRLVRNQTGKGNASSAISRIGVISIALGLAMMIIANATGKGLQKEVRQKLISLNGHIQVFYYDNNNSEVAINPITVSEKLFQSIENIPEVSKLYQTASKGGIIRTKKSFEGVLSKGVSEEYLKKNANSYLIEGKIPKFASKKASNKSLISKYLANRLGLGVGDKFQLLFFSERSKIPYQRYMIVSGIYNSGFEEFDSNYIFIDLRHLQRINHWDENQVGNLEVFLKNTKDVEKVNSKIYKLTDSTLNTQSIFSKYSFIMDWLNLMDYNIYIIIGIMIVVGGVNMITSLLVTVLDRVQLIGVLKALGSEDKSIRKIFIYQAIYLIGLGLIFGNLFSLGLLYLQSYFGFIKLNPDIYYVSQAPVFINLWQIMLLNIGTLVLCSCMLIIPSYIIGRMSPISAIKTD